ncbi:MAG: hypothetical protein H6696_19225 [Deferribacteres bacterium]|nr:hypothetical protein [candidate division KSB1 bacterium]MCB9504062.1 hypothetical protein [Deferribacteres bacterium]
MNKSEINLKAWFAGNFKYFLSIGIVAVLLLPVSDAIAQSAYTKSVGRLVKKDGVTAYIVRDDMSKALKLTMLIAHKSTFSNRVVKMVGHDVVPLTFSVSPAPNMAIYFDPYKIKFIQNGKSWSADSLEPEKDVIRLSENEPFGGEMKNGDTHQAVFLLPGWFDINAPLYVRYDDENKQLPLVSADSE